MERVFDIIDAAEAVDILKALVRAPSVNPPGDTTAAVRVLGERLAAAGMPWRSLEAQPGIANLVARLPGERPGKTLILNGHIDVVPAGENWTRDPFGGEERDGRIYGRGSCDMKAGVAAMLLAVLALKRSGAPFAGEVLLTAVADEETGGRLGTKFLIEQGVGRGAAFAIVGEPTNLRVELGNRGIAWLEVTVNGRAGHPGRPAHGANAVHYAGKLIDAVANTKYAVRDDLFEVPTPSATVTIVHGGTKANVIPDRCELTIDRRLLPGETAPGAVQEIEQLIASLPAEGINAQVACIMSSDPYLIARDDPTVRALARAHERVIGSPPRLGAKGGATDGSHLYHLGGVPTALYGPGDPARAHTADEFVEVESVLQAARVYALAALDLLGADA